MKTDEQPKGARKATCSAKTLTRRFGVVGALLLCVGAADAQNLHAEDHTRPTVVIVSPRASQRFESAWVTFKGRASDNVELADVFYRLNDSEWDWASGTANWSVDTELTVGKNVLRVYATDAAGNASRTSAVSVTYVLKAPLAVEIDGKGTVKTNYNGWKLEIGRSYSMTAQGTSGFAFSHWSGNQGLESSNATLKFVMEQDLSLTAHFVDRARPAVTITSPRSGQRITAANGQWRVTGTASDNSELVDILVKVNDSPWESLGGSNKWETTVPLLPGRNAVLAYAVDAAGNVSHTRGASFTHVVTSTLTVVTNGKGTITRSFKGSLLEVGKTYTVKAQPGSGYVFAGWKNGTSELLSASESFSFTMQPNLVLQADFIENPFTAVRGTYTGLFYPANEFGEMSTWVAATNSGGISVNVASDGSFKGSLWFEGAKLPFSGQLSVDMTAAVTVPKAGSQPLTLNLQAAPEEGFVGGTVERGETWSSSLLARRAANSGNPFAGKYSLVLLGCDTGSCFIGPPVPFGDSIGTVSVSRSGVLTMKGTLSDGHEMAQQISISADGYWPFYAAPYDGQGMVIGWLNLAQFLDGNSVVWEKPATPWDNYYPNGFSSPRVTVVTPYETPEAGDNALNWTNGVLAINSGNLPAQVLLSNRVEIVNNRVRDLGGDIDDLSMMITSSNGTFKGSFSDPVTGEPTSFSGILVQSSPEFFNVVSGGWFLGTNASGTVRLRPSTPE